MVVEGRRRKQIRVDGATEGGNGATGHRRVDGAGGREGGGGRIGTWALQGRVREDVGEGCKQGRDDRVDVEPQTRRVS